MKNSSINSIFLLTLVVVVLFFCAGWPSLSDLDSLSNLKSKDIKAGLINSTGIVTSDQVDTVINAAEKIDAASRGLSAEQQYYLGRAVSALVLKKYPLYRESPSFTQYLNLIGTSLSIRTAKPETFGGYHFAIIDSEEINALSTPGGFVFISKGFLKLIPNEEALAAVLAHEIGHIILGHGVGAISNAKITEATAMLGKEAIQAFGPSEIGTVTDLFGASVNEIYETLVTSGYSRSQEYEADAFAASLLVKTGYSVKGLTTMLDELGRVRGHSRGGWSDTHPAPHERKSSVKIPKQNLEPSAVEVRTARFNGNKLTLSAQ